MYFADDWLVFSQASAKAAQSLKDLLYNCQIASGQMVNFHKYTIYFSYSVPRTKIHLLPNIPGIPHHGPILKSY